MAFEAHHVTCDERSLGSHASERAMRIVLRERLRDNPPVRIGVLTNWIPLRNLGSSCASARNRRWVNGSGDDSVRGGPTVPVKS